MLGASFALKDSHCHRSSIIDFTEDQQPIYVYIYILMTYLNSYVSYKAIDQRERRMIGHVIDIQRVKLVKAPFEHLVIKSPYLRYRHQRRLQRSRYMKSDS